MTIRGAVLALLLGTMCAHAEPVVVASGAYPEGLLWHGGRMFFAEMGADRVSIIESGKETGKTREFWSDAGCGPTAISPFGLSGFLVNCHLGRHVVEVSAVGKTGRRFRASPGGIRLGEPNASSSDGQGGVYFSDSGLFSAGASATGRVYHLSVSGTMTEVAAGLHYANGVAFDGPTRTLYVSEHLGRRILAFAMDANHRVVRKQVLADFSQHPATRIFTYPEAGPDGLALGPGYLAVAEYGEGRVHVFDRTGQHRNTLTVPMRFVDTVAFDDARQLYAGGAFQNAVPPFNGVIVRFAPGEWQKPSN